MTTPGFIATHAKDAVFERGLRFPETFPTLREASLTLRELREEDIPAWFARATDLEAADLAGDPVPDSIERGSPWLERQRTLFRQQAGIRWAIVPVGAAVSVGTVGLTLSPSEDGIAELGIVIARPQWGQGIGSTAARMAVRYALFDLGMREIRAEVLQRNPASIRLLEKAGFSKVRDLPPTDVEPEAMVLYALSRPHPGAG